MLIYFALRRYLQALHIARPVMITLLTANLVNLAGNWMLVLGHLGAPRLGAEGAGWATCFSRIYMAAALAYVLWKHDPEVLRISWRPDAARMWALLKLGAPAAGQMAVEIGVFATVTVLVSKLNATALAGHQIALTTVSTTFMMPLGISSAAAVRVGFALGRGDRHGGCSRGMDGAGTGRGGDVGGGDRVVDGARVDRAFVHAGCRGDRHGGGDPARGGILSTVRRIADRGDGLAAGRGRHAHADGVPSSSATG